MFLKAFESALAHTGVLTQVAKAGICSSRWSRHQWHNKKMNPYLLYHFSKENTLKVLERYQETQNPIYQLEPKDLITFDKLSESVNSETHRVFDLYHKKFFALKTLSLDSEMAWKQFNLMLRQHFSESGRLAPIHSFTYNEANKEVKILSELQKTVIGEYAYFRKSQGSKWGSYFKKRQGEKWSCKELKTVLSHLMKIIKALKFHGASTDSLKADNIFLDSKEGKLRAFDYPGANIASHNYGFSRWSSWNVNSFDVAVHTLVKIVDPYAPVDNPEEARAYLNINYPEFKSDLLDMEKDSGWLRYFRSGLLPLEEIFESKDYDEYLLGNLKKTFDQRFGKNTEENWAFVTQGLGQFNEAEVILKNVLNKNIDRFGSTHPQVTKSYLNLAELYDDQGKHDLSSKYFQNAFNTSYSTPVHDKDVLGRLYLKYGKLLMKLNAGDKRSAMTEFQKALDLLKDSPNGSARLKQEIKQALDEMNIDNHHNKEFYNAKDWEKKKWRKRKIFKIIFTLFCLHLIYHSWFKHHHHHDDDKHDRKWWKQHSHHTVEETQQNVLPPTPPQDQNRFRKVPQEQPQQKNLQVVAHVEPPKVIKQSIPVIPQEKAPIKNVELNLPKTVVVAPPHEAQQDSKFAWFLFGLNVIVGFAGLTLHNAN